MHKKIALLIEKIFNESPYRFGTCYVKSNDTNGFWEVKIDFDKDFQSREDAHSNSLIRAIKEIGFVYGEQLYIQDNKTNVEVS